MKRIIIVLSLMVLAASAQAGIIADIQTGLVAENTFVDVYNGVVTGVRYNGFFVAEAPYGANNGIWVYTGSSTGVVDGDIVTIQGGEYYEYFGLSEIEATAAVGAVVTIMGPGTLPAPSFVPLGVLMTDPEPWESCMITIPTGMIVVGAPNNYGEWNVEGLGGVEILFDDYWYDDTTVTLGDCYDNGTGILGYGFGQFRFFPFADGLAMADCVVPDDATSFGAVKALYR